MRCKERLKAVAALADQDLARELTRLAACERSTTASLIAHLAEFDARRLHLAAGFPSLFRYCTESLRLSEHEAYNRIEAARLAGRFPHVVDRVEDGSLNLTTVRLLAPHLTEDNEEMLLGGASHRSKSEVEELIARFFPRPVVPSTIRRLPRAETSEPLPASALPGKLPESETLPASAPGQASVAAPTEVQAEGVGGAGGGQGQPPVTGDVACPANAAPPSTRRAVMRPLASDRYEIRFTATAATYEKLRMARDLLRHAVPDGDLDTIVDRALTVLLEDLVRKKFAATRRPESKNKAAGVELTVDRSDPTPAAERCGTRHIPAAVKRAVWLRDGGRCVFTGKGGRRCGTRAFLEFHHQQLPFAMGGAATVENIQLRCHSHNAYEADLFYGQLLPTVAELVPERVRRDLTGSQDGRRPAAGE